MFTPDSLLTIAIDARAEYERLLKLYPVGTSNSERNESWDRSERALACAAWMEQQGVESAAHVGPFSSFDLKKGSIVRIRKGSRIFSTDPSVGQEGIVSPRAQTVTVWNYFPGYVHEGRVINPTVRWSGSKSYWRWTDANNVDLV